MSHVKFCLFTYDVTCHLRPFEFDFFFFFTISFVVEEELFNEKLVPKIKIIMFGL